MNKFFKLAITLLVFSLVGCGENTKKQTEQVQQGGTPHWVQVDKVEIPVVPIEVQVRKQNIELDQLNKEVRYLKIMIEVLQKQLFDQNVRLEIAEQGGVDAVITDLNRELNKVEKGQEPKGSYSDYFSVTLWALSKAGAEPAKINKLLDRFIAVSKKAKDWPYGDKDYFEKDIAELRSKAK